MSCNQPSQTTRRTPDLRRQTDKIMDSANIGSITNPVNSEEFLPPAACRHKRGDMDFVKSQQADRERMVCAIGLDVHYELNVLSGETGSYQPRLRPFNPRMSGPACPYNYTGKFLGEVNIADVCDDPIELGRKIHAEQPYDTALYRKHDPRKVSKTVIIRDYGCKVPITLADTEHIARAVLNNYPDRYVDFLKEFVSNIMGEAMKKYLITYRDALNRILENPTELNRVSWGAYKNVQGGHSPYLPADNKQLTAEQVYSTDCTLPWDEAINTMLNQVVINKGDTTTGSLTASDVFDMRPCLQQHIATLDDMSSLWCQGFATKERYALAMIWWCNEQGRNLSQDLGLLKDSDHPNYNLIELHVPVNPFHMKDPEGAPKDPSPDQNCAVRARLMDEPRGVPNKYKMQETVSFRVPVGQWTGNNETPNVILNSSKSQFAWGWGHPANLTVNVPVFARPIEGEAGSEEEWWHAEHNHYYTMCAPYLRYVFNRVNVDPNNRQNTLSDDGLVYRATRADRARALLGQALRAGFGQAVDRGGPPAQPLTQEVLRSGTLPNPPSYDTNSWRTIPVQQNGAHTQGGFKVYDYPCSTEYVRSHRWGAAFAGETAEAQGANQVQRPVDKAVVNPANTRKNRTLRESLGADDDDARSAASFYRGAASDRTYGSMMGLSTETYNQDTGNPKWSIMQFGDDGSLDQQYPGDVSQEICATEERKPPVIDNDPGACAPDGVSIVRRVFSGACRHLDPFFTNGPNCLVTTVDDKIPDDRVVNVLIKSRCFSYYNISEIGTSDFFRRTMATALSNTRTFASTAGITSVPTSDVGAYLNSYTTTGANYPFRTVVPPLAVLGSHNGSILPFAEMYTSGADQVRTFDANFNTGNELEMRDASGNVTPEAANFVVINQPFIPSFCINMNNIDWKRTEGSGPGNKGYTDLVMNDVKTTTQMQYMKNAMRIITVRTVLSVILGMDTAALICEEPIPSNRLVTWIAGLPVPSMPRNRDVMLFNDFACSPIIVSGACNDALARNDVALQKVKGDIATARGYAAAGVNAGDQMTAQQQRLFDQTYDRERNAFDRNHQNLVQGGALNAPFDAHQNPFSRYYLLASSSNITQASWRANGTVEVCRGVGKAPPHFTQRILPYAVDDSSASRGFMDEWKYSFWKQHYTCSIKNRNVVFESANGGATLHNDNMQLVLTNAMIISLMERLDRFLKLVRNEMATANRPTDMMMRDRREDAKTEHLDRLHDLTRSHMLRMAIIARFASPKHVERLRESRKAFTTVHAQGNAQVAGEIAAWVTVVGEVADPASDCPNRQFQNVHDMTDAYSAYTQIHEINSVDYHRRVFNSVNCAVPVDPNLYSSANNPSEDNFPYDVAFHGHIGGISTHKLVQPIGEVDSQTGGPSPDIKTSPFYCLRVPSGERHMSTNNFPQLRMVESLFRDPRAFYAFNPAEWKTQWDRHEEEFKGDILNELAGLDSGLFTLPYFLTGHQAVPNEDPDFTALIGGTFDFGCIPHASAPALLLAQYHRGGWNGNVQSTLLMDNLEIGLRDANGKRRPVGADFKKASQNYIMALVKHAAEHLATRSHFLPVIESLGIVSPPSATDPEPRMRGATGIEDETYASTSGRAPPYTKNQPPGDIKRQTAQQPGVPIVRLFAREKNTFVEDTRTYFPIHPAGAFTSGTVNSRGNRLADGLRAKLPVAGATTLNTGVQEHAPRFSLMPVGNVGGYHKFDKLAETNGSMMYNVDITRPQMFAMLDAAGLLWHAREYINPSDCNRPKITEAGQCDSMHYWCRTLVETFVSSREIYREREASSLWEIDVKKYPASALPSSLIGNLCDDTWRSYFPLLPFDHELREDLRRARALSILWGTLPTYSSGADSTGTSGAWMPLAPAHQMRLYGTVGLFDGKFRVPKNPWLPNNGTGISLVFNQSYHSVYHCDSYRAEHFQDWLLNANRYQIPVLQQEGCSYPFSQYGGTPVEADFIPHIVERSTDPGNSGRHRQLVYNRFGFTSPLRIGNQFHDTGLLQDMFQYKYRPYADLSSKQRQMAEATTVHISNFLSYARTHTIIALASCNHGTEDESVPRIVRNLYRLYVDTYECMGSNTDDDSIPCIMGFSPAPINKREDRGVVLYAGSLACLNSKLATFCSSSMNRGERVCAIYKQVYLNDATLLYTRLLRQERRKILHDNNFNRARMKRGRGYTRHDFDRDLVDLQDAYIEFLQNTVLGMLLEGGADLQGVPLHLLEPRELEVSLFQEDDNLVGNDFLTPRTKEIISQSDFGGDNLTRSQLAILSLIPPNHRVLGTLRLNQSMEVVDLEHAKKQIQKETMESNKKVWQRYSESLISAAFAQKLLEVDGPIDFSLDMSSVQDPMRMRFDMSAFKDPLKESEKIKSRMTTTHAQSSSSLSLQQRGEKLRKSVASDSVLNMTTKELNKALALVRERVERDYTAHNGTKKRIQILEMLRIPAHVRRILRPEYEGDMA